MQTEKRFGHLCCQLQVGGRHPERREAFPGVVQPSRVQLGHPEKQVPGGEPRGVRSLIPDCEELAAQLHFDAQVAMDVMEVGQIVQRLEQRVGFADLLAQLLSPSAGSFDLRGSEAPRPFQNARPPTTKRTNLRRAQVPR